MGEIADGMLDGTLCAGCGEYLGYDWGIPLYCTRACAPKGTSRDLIVSCIEEERIVR